MDAGVVEGALAAVPQQLVELGHGSSVWVRRALEQPRDLEYLLPDASDTVTREPLAPLVERIAAAAPTHRPGPPVLVGSVAPQSANG